MENEENKVENQAENTENPPESPENSDATPGNPDETPENPPETPDGPGWIAPERLEGLLAYCKLSELRDDPEVAALIPVLYSAAVGYMDNAGIALPEEGTTRRALYDLCVNHLVLDAYERRETAMVATVVADNPVFRRMLVQLKQSQPGWDL